MAQRAGRITCPRCGANNFDTVTSCWKCGAPVGAGAIAQPPMPAAPTPVSNLQASSMPLSYPSDRAPAMAAPAPMSYAPSIPTGDIGVARRAALALALTLPFLGLPVGWIFMMFDDRGKQAIGRWCANWSMIGLVLHLFLTYFMFMQSGPILMRLLLPVVEAASHRNSPGRASTPNLP